MTKHKAWLRGVYQKEYGTVQYISVQYSAVVILKNTFQFFIFSREATLELALSIS